MSRGEGIACCLFSGSLDNIKIGVKTPGTGNTEEELGKLVANSANKTCDKNEIAFSLVYTPEEENSNYEEEGLLTKMGNERKEPVKDRVMTSR